jgi:hypothetical protein
MNRNRLIETIKSLVAYARQGQIENLLEACDKADIVVAENDNEKEQYFNAVKGAGDDIVLNLDPDAEDLDEELMISVDEYNSEWTMNDEYAIVVLQQSNHPTNEIFIAGVPDTECGKANFPFCTFATGAMEEDIREYLRTEYGFDGPITKRIVKAAQRKARK